MRTLRATRNLLERLRPVTADGRASATALGDWFATRLVVDRRPPIPLIASRGYLPILLPARHVASLPARLPDLVAARLHRAQVPAPLVANEIARMSPVLVGPANGDSVVDVLLEFALMVSLHLDRGGWDESGLPGAEDWLARTPCHASRPHDEVVFPDRDTPCLLQSAWGAC